jgi:rhamnulokinase
MKKHAFLAFDLGAESGRAMVGVLHDGTLQLHEVHRFPNGPVQVHGHLHWDIFRLVEELKTGLRKACASGLPAPESIGIDTWGVDFGFIGKDGSVLELPYAYRDPQTDGMVEELLRMIPREALYGRTGIQFLQFNSLVQLVSLRKRGSPLLDAAGDLLFIPDLLTYLLTGVKRSEFTIASTSQIINPVSRSWDREILSAVGLKASLFQEIVLPGTVIGNLEDPLRSETGAPDIPLVAVATHDTGSAVAAVPAGGGEWAYISSGTWSLMGIEIERPILTPEAMRHNFTNEGGVDGKIRFLKNIAGLWLVQECRRAWTAEGKDYSYDRIVELAGNAAPFRSLVDPDWHGFLHPRDMREAITSYCAATGQIAPGTPGEFARCVFESLSLKYRQVLDELHRIQSRRVNAIHIIGGGSKNRLLCQLAANTMGLPVLAGPSEATAIGNIMVQARTGGHCANLNEMREIIRLSCTPDRYQPGDTDACERAYERFQSLLTQPQPQVHT